MRATGGLQPCGGANEGGGLGGGAMGFVEVASEVRDAVPMLSNRPSTRKSPLRSSRSRDQPAAPHRRASGGYPAPANRGSPCILPRAAGLDFTRLETRSSVCPRQLWIRFDCDLSHPGAAPIPPTMFSVARQSALRVARTRLSQPQPTIVPQYSAFARLASTLAILEQKEGKILPQSLAAITAGTKIGGSITAFVAGSGVKSAADEAAKAKGVEKVVYVENGAYDKVSSSSASRHCVV